MRVSEDYSDGVRDIRRKLIPHMTAIREEHADDRSFRCYLHYDKLVAGKNVYTLNQETDELVSVANR